MLQAEGKASERPLVRTWGSCAARVRLRAGAEDRRGLEGNVT